MDVATQSFDYFVVLDFEATCDTGPPPDPQEIIEYPSLLLDAGTFGPADEFQSFVRPRHHPVLTQFCIELTGITQDQVDAAPHFPAVLESHLQWLAGHGLDVSGNGGGSSFAFILCGDWDFVKMLPRQCRACEPPIERIPRAFRQWVNIKQPFAGHMRLRKSPGLAGMLAKLGLEFEGRRHRGIDDCRNIARLARHMALDGATFSITTEMPLSSYPPVTLRLRHGERSELVTLERRSMKSLRKLANYRFRRPIHSIRDEQGRELSQDSDLLELHSGTELTIR